MESNFEKKRGEIPEEEYLYKSVLEGKKKSRVWSLASLIAAILSVLCCCVPWPGAVLGVLAVVLAVVSRINIGYFDGMALAGLIVGIFGLVFSISIMIIASTDWYKDVFIKAFEESSTGGV